MQQLEPESIRKNVKIAHICPICKNHVIFGIEHGTLTKIMKEGRFPFTHVVLHGNPVHAMIAYIDSNLAVRGVESSKSIEIARDGDTFSQLLRNWSNPT